jgi:hypothetical protein
MPQKPGLRNENFGLATGEFRALKQAAALDAARVVAIA